MRIALLAERMRVEERQIADAFKAKDLSCELIKPAAHFINLNETTEPDFDLYLDRSVTTRDEASLMTLLAAHGSTVVDRPATTRLLADRLALMRHLVIAGLAVPQSRVAFGEDSALEAIEELGYPVVIKTLDVRPGFPSAFVDDRDSAEAIVEHRNVLGHDQTTLVQQFQKSIHDRSLRAVVVGSEVVAFDARPHDGWRPNASETYVTAEQVDQSARDLAEAVISRVGTGIYAILMIETEHGPVVTGIENLVTFRHLAEQDIDIAGMIVEFSLSQHPVAQAR